MDQGIQELTNKISGRQPLKNMKRYGLLGQTISIQIL